MPTTNKKPKTNRVKAKKQLKLLRKRTLLLRKKAIRRYRLWCLKALETFTRAAHTVKSRPAHKHCNATWFAVPKPLVALTILSMCATFLCMNLFFIGVAPGRVAVVGVSYLEKLLSFTTANSQGITISDAVNSCQPATMFSSALSAVFRRLYQRPSLWASDLLDRVAKNLRATDIRGTLLLLSKALTAAAFFAVPPLLMALQTQRSAEGKVHALRALSSTVQELRNLELDRIARYQESLSAQPLPVMSSDAGLDPLLWLIPLAVALGLILFFLPPAAPGGMPLIPDMAMAVDPAVVLPHLIAPMAGIVAAIPQIAVAVLNPVPQVIQIHPVYGPIFLVLAQWVQGQPHLIPVFNNHLAIFAGQLMQNQLAAAQQAHFLEIMGQLDFPGPGAHLGAIGAFLPFIFTVRSITRGAQKITGTESAFYPARSKPYTHAARHPKTSPMTLLHNNCQAHRPTSKPEKRLPALLYTFASVRHAQPSIKSLPYSVTRRPTRLISTGPWARKTNTVWAKLKTPLKNTCARQKDEETCSSGSILLGYYLRHSLPTEQLLLLSISLLPIVSLTFLPFPTLTQDVSQCSLLLLACAPAKRLYRRTSLWVTGLLWRVNHNLHTVDVKGTLRRLVWAFLAAIIFAVPPLLLALQVQLSAKQVSCELQVLQGVTLEWYNAAVTCVAQHQASLVAQTAAPAVGVDVKALLGTVFKALIFLSAVWFFPGDGGAPAAQALQNQQWIAILEHILHAQQLAGLLPMLPPLPPLFPPLGIHPGAVGALLPVLSTARLVCCGADILSRRYAPLQTTSTKQRFTSPTAFTGETSTLRE